MAQKNAASQISPTKTEATDHCGPSGHGTCISSGLDANCEPIRHVPRGNVVGDERLTFESWYDAC